MEKEIKGEGEKESENSNKRINKIDDYTNKRINKIDDYTNHHLHFKNLKEKPTTETQ